MKPITVELMLLRWSVTSNGGATITFQLPDPDALEPFKMATLKKGGQAGQVYMSALQAVAEGEPESPPPPPEPTPGAEPEPPKGAALAKLAGMLCGSKHFCAWLCGANRDVWDIASMRSTYSVTSSEVAAEAIRIICGIRSRAELDHDPEAAEKFHRYIRVPYSKVAPRA